MGKRIDRQLTEEQIKAINEIVSHDDRVEVVPVKDGGIKILRTRREIVNIKDN